MEMKNTALTIGALAAGAAGMYLLDREGGRRRRALFRDKMVRASHVTGDALGVVGRDLLHRAHGTFAAQRRRIRGEEYLPSDRLEARARAILGRVVSHPHAIAVEASDGRLLVSGYILEREVQPLLTALQMVRGVREVENHLEVGRNPAEMPSLQGGRPRAGLVPDVLQRRMAPASRILVGAGALGLLGYGLVRRDIVGGILSTLGLLSGVRAATNLEPRRLFGIGAGREAVRLQNTIEIDAPIEEVFDFLAHLENFPRFMHHIREVRRGEGDVWHWEADGPLGIGVSWDALITRFEPGRRIAWKSTPGSLIGNTGNMWFEHTNRGTTRVHIQMGYNPPAGAVGHAVAALLGADPLRQMDEDLVRLKSLIERGKTTAHGEQVTKEEIAPK